MTLVGAWGILCDYEPWDGPSFQALEQAVAACLCETDYCNSYRGPGEPRPDPGSPHPHNMTRIQTTANVNTTTTTTTTTASLTSRDNSTAAAASAEPLRCARCGDLFSSDECGAEGAGAEQCGAGEACLLYTWRRSAATQATVRQCFPRRILLGMKTSTS